jgi:hypothetical protein
VRPRPQIVESKGVGFRHWLSRRLASLSLAPQQRELKRAREAADAELSLLTSPPLRLAWRSAELTAGSRRLELAGELRQLVDAADARYLPNASPIDRAAVRAETETLLALAARLCDLERPVSPRGILALERLLRDNDGPLYAAAGPETLARALAEVTQALEVSL